LGALTIANGVAQAVIVPDPGIAHGPFDLALNLLVRWSNRIAGEADPPLPPTVPTASSRPRAGSTRRRLNGTARHELNPFHAKLLIQPGRELAPNKSNQKPSKKAWISFVLFVRIGTFQWVTSKKIKKIDSRLGLCAKRLKGPRAGCLKRALSLLSPGGQATRGRDPGVAFLITEDDSSGFCFTQDNVDSLPMADDMSGMASARSVR
jgi:hypothetical protein